VATPVLSAASPASSTAPADLCATPRVVTVGSRILFAATHAGVAATPVGSQASPRRLRLPPRPSAARHLVPLAPLGHVAASREPSRRTPGSFAGTRGSSSRPRASSRRRRGSAACSRVSLARCLVSPTKGPVHSQRRRAVVRRGRVLSRRGSLLSARRRVSPVGGPVSCASPGSRANRGNHSRHWTPAVTCTSSRRATCTSPLSHPRPKARTSRARGTAAPSWDRCRTRGRPPRVRRRPPSRRASLRR
jgi:hypothetical protein